MCIYLFIIDMYLVEFKLKRPRQVGWKFVCGLYRVETTLYIYIDAV